VAIQELIIIHLIIQYHELPPALAGGSKEFIIKFGFSRNG
jgi:hypothetical protein